MLTNRRICCPRCRGDLLRFSGGYQCIACGWEPDEHAGDLPMVVRREGRPATPTETPPRSSGVITDQGVERAEQPDPFRLDAEQPERRRRKSVPDFMLPPHITPFRQGTPR